MTIEEIKKRIAELEQETHMNAEDFKKGELSYEELHSMQYLLFKEIDELKEKLK